LHKSLTGKFLNPENPLYRHPQLLPRIASFSNATQLCIARQRELISELERRGYTELAARGEELLVSEKFIFAAGLAIGKC